MENDEKQCPRCAETIKKAAVICRFCQYGFLQEVSSTPPQPERPQQVFLGPHKNSLQSCGGCIGAALIGIFALSILSQFLDGFQKLVGH